MAQIIAQKCRFSCNEVAVLYCKGCDQFLCVECRKIVHDKVPNFKDHTIVNIHIEGNRVFKPQPVCDTHKNTFVYYCSRCEILTCVECMTSTHNGHKTERIKSVADARRQDVNQIIEQIKAKAKIVKIKLETIDTEHATQIKSDCASYVLQVEGNAGDLHQVIDKYKLIHITTASDFEKNENDDLGRKRAFFKSRHDETVDRLSRFENLMQETHDSTFLTEWKVLQADVKLNDEEAEDRLASPNLIERFNQSIFTKSVIDEIDDKFQMRLSEQEHIVVRLSEDIAVLTKELKEKQEKIDNQSILIREKWKEVTNFVDENEKLKRDLTERNVKESLIETEHEQTIVRLKDEIGALKEELTKKQEHIDDLLNLPKELNEEKKKVTQMVDENAKLKTDLKERLVKESLILEEQKQTVARLTKENATLKKEKKEKEKQQDDIANLSRKLTEEKKKVYKLVDENDTLKSEFIARKVKESSKLKEHEQTIVRLTEDKGILEQKMKEKQKEVDDLLKLSRDLSEEKKKVSELVDNNSKLKAEMTKAAKECSETNKQKHSEATLTENKGTLEQEMKEQLKEEDYPSKKSEGTLQMQKSIFKQENELESKRKEMNMECDFIECRCDIHPVLKQKQFKERVVKILKARKISFNPTTLEMTCSIDQMTLFNQHINKEFGGDIALFSKDIPDVLAEGCSNQTKSNLKTYVNSQLVVEINISYMEYQMLHFFSPDCQLLKGSPTYENGCLRKLLQEGESECEFNTFVQSKSMYFESLTTSNINMPDGCIISDNKLEEIETELEIISPEIFCSRSKDAKTLILKSNRSEKLFMAKLKCENVLGIKQEGRIGRRAIVFTTDPPSTKEGHEQMDNKSFSVTSSRSSFSRSLNGGSRSPLASPQSVAIFKTSEGLLIHLHLGNILNLKVDCIVNAANEGLGHYGGVADVISRVAGYGFQQESDDYIQRHGQLNVTECCTTSAGNLPYQCVIHAVGPRWYNYNDKRKCANDLEETVKNCFSVAEKKMMKSIAIPAISSGIFGVPKEVCCREFSKAVQDFSRKNGNKTCLKEIHFGDKDAGIVSMIQKEFSQIFNAIISTQ